MKIKILLIISGFIFFTACNELDLNPLSEGSSENWFSNEQEINMSLNDLYGYTYWGGKHKYLKRKEEYTDDWTYRNAVSDVLNGSIDGTSDFVIEKWQSCYKGIAHANTIIENLEDPKVSLSEDLINRYLGEARFVRAAQYAELISYFGDVVFVTKQLDIDEAFAMGRTSKETILESIYEDYDFAIQYLPVSYSSSQPRRATKGAALAMKARIALYNQDWALARDAAKACMDLGVYSLHSNFAEFFYSETKESPESIFRIPSSTEFGSDVYIKNWKTRNSGGTAAREPSWDLFFSFLCIDGLPIHESPLFDPQNPFENRDPRCAVTFAEFNKPYLGIMYSPHPDSLTVMNFNTGQRIPNNDTRSVIGWAAYHGMVLKKFVSDAWKDVSWVKLDNVVMRYADVLLMYAEAKVELDEIDASMLNAINMVRARAYGVDVSATSEYPAVTNEGQSRVRKIVRTERRMELAWEGLRYMDILRWGIAEQVLNFETYGMLNVPELYEKVINKGLWFFPEVPEMDEENWFPVFEPTYNKGLIRILSTREFDPAKHYLWPIPSKEILINENLDQNPNY
ncbi:RagB/SusD family nutrient uptake outer membrane protein [Mariniphaga sediminis]|uniref:RagB/SusD family nutrient uptake outer membrane protein n=1 Tax=Mariniphaga sediminis TaxID=1628158 RepID=A0A399D5M4_9BACT|nr:RagB/SusD family nutrient uptake outer membrane protein [Mariniphaga sediminis]RIH67184.1 RagB/SusD family nutrient uptake outer membrane protein [Mariniphaga sediminis]